MSLIEGDNTTFHASIEVADDGDERDAAALLVPVEALLDNTAYLKERVDGSGTINTGTLHVAGDAFIGDDLDVTDDLSVGGTVSAGSVEATSAQINNIEATSVDAFTYSRPEETVEKVEPLVAYPIGSGWELYELSTGHFVWRASVDTAVRLFIPISVPDGCDLVSFVARFAGGLHSNLPANKPTITLYRRNVRLTGATHANWTEEHPGTTTGSYNGFIDFEVGPGEVSPHETETDTGTYYAVITSESGTDALAGNVYQGGFVKYKRTRVDRGW
ncbi:hypothetical protein WMF30_40110 [Sorangium sp. So ce134]